MVRKVSFRFIFTGFDIGGQLHAVSGPEFSLLPSDKKPTGYIVSMESGELSGTWNVPGGLQNPHDIAVSHDGNIVYVVELNPFKVWKLTNGGSDKIGASIWFKHFILHLKGTQQWSQIF